MALRLSYQQLIISPPSFLYQLMLYQATATPFKAGKEKKGGDTCGILSEVKDEWVRTKQRAAPQCFEVNKYVIIYKSSKVCAVRWQKMLGIFQRILVQMWTFPLEFSECPL